MNRTLRSYEAGIALKAGTAAAHITDDEGKAVATRIPYLDVFDRSNDATELHDAPQKSRPAPIKSCGCKCYVTSGRFAISGPKTYFIGHMFKAFESCIPTKSTIVPHGQDWLHE